MVKFVSATYRGSHSCLCCHVRSGCLALAAVYLITWSTMAVVEMVKLFWPDSYTGEIAYKKFDDVSYFACDLLMVFISAVTIYGIFRYRPRLMAPFLIYLIVEFIVYCIEVLSLYIPLPSYAHPKNYISYVFYFPENDVVSSLSIKVMLMYTVVYAIVLGVKIFLIQSVWNCYKYVKEKEEENSLVQAVMKFRSENNPPAYEDIGKMPPYDEIVKMPPKEFLFYEPPPAYRAM
uniref:Lysosomal-associated transmembrane protein 4A n=1 Tax=Callorhinchus milii TaxID=7868 RepID=V9L1M9_CALMI